MTYVYEPQVGSQIYGTHVPYNQGYDAYSQRNFPAAENNSPSGYFRRADGSQIALWVTSVTADFSLAGQAAQSRMTREFYTRNFNDVALHITGNVSGTYEFNRLALFVREHQWKGLNYINQGGTGVDQTITFILNNNTPASFSSGPLRNVKGPHQPWQVQGYISTIAAGAVAHNVAPQFEIDLIVCDTASNGNTAIWSEVLEQPAVLSSFIGLVNTDVANGNTFTGFVPTPTIPQPPKSKPTPPGKVPTILANPQTWTTALASSIASGITSVANSVGDQGASYGVAAP